jgi:hypothetical protein
MLGWKLNNKGLFESIENNIKSEEKNSAQKKDSSAHIYKIPLNESYQICINSLKNSVLILRTETLKNYENNPTLLPEDLIQYFNH